MTAAVASISLPLGLSDPSAEARKRRREILSSQRSQAIDADIKPVSSLVVPTLVEPPAAKRQKPNEMAKAKTKPAKKPQMKYDPDVPMTKEEATAWRREQRRKRNRESAAASRQRQRDRITELEVEVEDWKTKYESIMETIKKLEESSGKGSSDLLPEQTLQILTTSEEQYSKFVSPPSSPGHTPSYSPVASPIASSSLITSSVTQVTPKEDSIDQMAVPVEQEHSDKMISRQAAS